MLYRSASTACTRAGPIKTSSYYQSSALYPLIDLLERVALRFEREESPPHKLRKLEGFLV